ncbi:MAG: hypothetical protein HC925_05560, partial [Coleofasciculaceae cyanobacterium SM2_3_26]|nr:hypothetical protein [Coleofasciculaceae cyanobacterium SM2_3_26]
MAPQKFRTITAREILEICLQLALSAIILWAIAQSLIPVLEALHPATSQTMPDGDAS